MRKQLIGFIMIAIFALFVAGCGATTSEPTGNSVETGSSASDNAKDTLVIGLDDDPPQLDPHRSSAAVDRQTFQSIYNKLVM